MHDVNFLIGLECRVFCSSSVEGVFIGEMMFLSLKFAKFQKIEKCNIHEIEQLIGFFKMSRIRKFYLKKSEI
jgi:hypothetical protein